MAPLPPLPDNNSSRVWLDYTSLGRPHSMLVRLNEEASSADASLIANRLAPVLANRMLTSDSITGVRFSEAGSNISTPIAFTPVSGAVSGALVTWENDPESAYLTLPGRGGKLGRKARIGFFSPVRTVTWPADNRFNPGDEPVIDTFRLNLVSALNTGSGVNDTAVNISNAPVLWQGYINISHNAYWQRKQRRGG